MEILFATSSSIWQPRYPDNKIVSETVPYLGEKYHLGNRINNLLFNQYPDM